MLNKQIIKNVLIANNIIIKYEWTTYKIAFRLPIINSKIHIYIELNKGKNTNKINITI